MKKTTFLFFVFLVTSFFWQVNAQKDGYATARGVDASSFQDPGQNRALNAVIYNTTHASNSGAEITSVAGGPNHSMGDAILLAGTERLINSITVDLFNLTSTASYDLTVRIYTGCPTSGATGACGSGVGVLVPGSTYTQNITTPGTLGTIYQRTLTYPVPVDLTTEADNTVTVMLTASRTDVFWRLGETPVVGGMPVGEVGNGFATRCGSATANNGCTRNFAIPNNFAMTIRATGPSTVCGNAPLAIPAAGTSGLMNPSLAPVADVGIIGTDFTINNVTINSVHSFAADLEIVLVSPAGTRLALCTDNGGSTGLDTAASLVFTDASSNNITTWTTGAPLANYRAEGGGNTFPVAAGAGPGADLNTVFAGQSMTGNWRLEINDDLGGDSGTLNSFCITFDPILVVGNPPMIVCPGTIMANNELGACGAVVNFAGLAIDPEDGNISGDIIATPPSGSFFNVGTTTVTLSVTDSDGNTATCDFDIIVTDNEAPVIACQDITVALDANGDYNLTPGEVVASATDNCGIASIAFEDPNAGDITECGPNGLPIPATGTSGPMDPSPAVVTTVGTVGVDYEIASVDLDLNHTFDGDLNISLTSPNGLILDLSSGNGGSGDNYTNTVFMDGFPSITTGAAPFTGTFQPEGGPMNTFFAGEPVNGNWTLNIQDLFGGDSGILNNYCITFASLAPPTVPSIDLTCANVGPNTFTVVVTDIHGNTSTCEAEVTVEDTIAPVISCIGEPAAVTDTASASPGLPFGAAPTVVTSTIDVTDDFIITDLNVDVNISHTWVGDVIVTLESPSGTTVTIIDRPGDITAPPDGCAGDNIVATLDDEAATPVEDECAAGTPTINGSFIPNNPLSAFDGESTLGTWTMTVEDAFPAFDDGVFNSWALHYTHNVAASPYDAILDGTTGTVTVNLADLLVSVDEACGYTVTTGGGAPIPGSISTLFATNNNGAQGGAIYFDVTVGAEDINVQDIDINTADPGAFTMEVYTIVGTYVGNEGNAGAWTLSANGTGTAMGLDVPSNAVLDVPVTLLAGTTYGMALVLDASHGHYYTNGDGTNQNYSNADVSLSLGAASNVPFDGSPFSPRVFNGTLHYEIGEPASTTIEFDCSQLGLNEVEITVTDDSGNTSTCTATVNVIDNTDPILVCMDATVALDENGMAEVTTDLFIDTANSFDACGITITAVDVTDVTCDDIGTAITVTVFASDASGNLASCTATLTVVDNLGPTLVGCPEDQTVDPGPLNLFYELPDYWALGGITFSDNCSEEGDITNFGQSPAAGTLLPDGTYTITLFAEDEYGNVGECTFILTIESILGKDDNLLDIATIVLYPNPANAVVNISNPKALALETATVYDLTGKMVQVYNLKGMGTEKALDVSMLASATYLVYIQSEHGSITKQLIKE